MLRRIITVVPKYTYNPKTGLFDVDITAESGNLTDTFALPPHAFIGAIKSMARAMEGWRTEQTDTIVEFTRKRRDRAGDHSKPSTTSDSTK